MFLGGSHPVSPSEVCSLGVFLGGLNTLSEGVL